MVLALKNKRVYEFLMRWKLYRVNERSRKTAWGGTAEFIARHFSKGDEIYIEGQLKNKTLEIGEKKIQTCFISVESARDVYGKNADITEREE